MAEFTYTIRVSAIERGEILHGLRTSDTVDKTLLHRIMVMDADESPDDPEIDEHANVNTTESHKCLNAECLNCTCGCSCNITRFFDID